MFHPLKVLLTYCWYSAGIKSSSLHYFDVRCLHRFTVNHITNIFLQLVTYADRLGGGDWEGERDGSGRHEVGT